MLLHGPLLILFVLSMTLNLSFIAQIPGVKALTVSGFGTERMVNSPSTLIQAEPSIATNPTNTANLVAILMNMQTPLQCVTYRSTDAGNSWGSPFPINAWSGGGCNDPVVRFKSDGTSYMVYETNTGDPDIITGLTSESALYTRYSPDGGYTWGPAGGVKITSNPNSNCRTFLDKPWLAVDSTSNTVYFSYTQIVISGLLCDTTTYSIMIAATTNPYGGPPWSFVNVASATRPISGSSLAIAPNGDVLVAWYDSLTDGPYQGQMSLKLKRSTNHGQTFSNEISITIANETPQNLCHFPWRVGATMFPRLTAGTNPSNPSSYNLYVVYGARPQPLPAGQCILNIGTHDSDIYFSKSTDGGNTWLANPIDLTPDGTIGNPNRFFPVIVADVDNVLHVTYADMGVDTTQYIRYQVMHRQSTDFGSTWDSPMAVSTVPAYSTANFIGDYFDMTTSGHTVVPIWTDLRSGDADVFTAVGILPSGGGGCQISCPNSPTP